MARDQTRLMAASDQRIGQVANEPLTAASLLGPENVADERDSDAARLYEKGQTPLLGMRENAC
jgi:hypothetical protein